MKKNNSVTSTKNTLTNNKETTMEKKIRTRTVVNPITKDEARELQEFLVKHNFCIKDAKKNIRVYRYLGHKNGKAIASRDFMYVVGADAYRTNKEKVFQDILDLSKKVFSTNNQVKNKEYARKMMLVEEKLLIKHNIAMIWDKSKTVRFKKFNHVITDASILEPLNEFVKNNSSNDNFVTHRIYKTKDNKHLQIFKRMAKMFEDFNSDIPCSNWNSFRYITKGGKVVAAYTMEDMVNTKSIYFPKGIQDKFDYNLNVVNKNYIQEIVDSLKM